MPGPFAVYVCNVAVNAVLSSGLFQNGVNVAGSAANLGNAAGSTACPALCVGGLPGCVNCAPVAAAAIAAALAAAAGPPPIIGLARAAGGAAASAAAAAVAGPLGMAAVTPWNAALQPIPAGVTQAMISVRARAAPLPLFRP